MRGQIMTLGLWKPGIVSMIGVLAAFAAEPARADGYVQTNLVANSEAFAPQILDRTLLNAWGIAIRPAGLGGHFWVESNGAGTSNEFVGDVGGNPLYIDNLRLVSVTGPSLAPAPGFAIGTPTGVVFNSSDNFTVTQGSITGAARFMMATDNGTISAWTERQNPNGSVDRPSYTKLTVDRSAQGAQYFGLAINPAQDRIYAANFAVNPGIQTFNASFVDVSAAAPFANPFTTSGSIKPGDFAPFNIQSIGTNQSESLFVTYAKTAEDPNHAGKVLPGEEVHGAGFGRIAQFDANGQLIRVWDDQGLLNSPWGLAFAPSGFGEFSGDLLVGNFGDGTIVAFDPVTHKAVGFLRDPSGKVITIDGLWGLQFGNGASLGEANALYFAAGPNDEVDGLFGRLSVSSVPEAQTYFMLSAGLLAVAFLRRRVAIAA
jgi:uncharacterized protein (TIGR03118 family)